MTQDQLAKVNEYLDTIGIENVKNIVVIADGATNGDVVRQLFKPHVILKEPGLIQETYNFDEEWWNKSYTGEKE